MSPKNTTLAILLFVQLALVALVYWPGGEKAAPKAVFFNDIALAQIQGLTITDDAQNSISLTAHDGLWAIQQGEYPANREAVEALLKKIIGLQSARLVTTTQASQIRLQVADNVFARKVDLRLAEGSSKSFFLGTAPNSKSIHFRLAGQNEVYLVKDLASWEMQADKESWWDTNYVSVPEDDLETVKITNPSGVLTLQRGEENKWLLAETPDGQQVSPEEIENFIGSVAKISVAEYLTKEQPENLGEPLCTIDYTSKSGQFSLTIWPADEEKDIHTAKASNKDFYVTIRAYLLKDVLEAQPSRFFVAPETPAENSATTGEEPKSSTEN
jgi:hypothetical protein